MLINKSKQLCVSGGNGFIGKYVVKELQSRGYTNLLVLNGKKDGDLRNERKVRELFNNNRISYFLHISATCGGIGINSKEGPRFFTDNILQGVHTINYAAKYGCEKFVLLSTICAYPDITDFKEEHLWDGREQITNRAYSSAKRALHVLLESHNTMPGNIILLGNSYGIGDNFTDSGHVIPEIIRKLNEYKTIGKTPVFFGNGESSRTFTYVEDSARGIVDVFEQYHDIEPINIGNEEEIKIKNLVSKIAKIIKCEEIWKWDESLPNGQMRRKLDCTKAKNLINWEPKVDLDTGLKLTIDWYLKNKENL